MEITATLVHRLHTAQWYVVTNRGNSLKEVTMDACVQQHYVALFPITIQDRSAFSVGIKAAMTDGGFTCMPSILSVTTYA